MTPRVNDQDKGANQAEYRQDNRPGLVFPKLPEASEYFREIHAIANLHPQATEQKRRRAVFPAQLLQSKARFFKA